MSPHDPSMMAGTMSPRLFPVFRSAPRGVNEPGLSGGAADRLLAFFETLLMTPEGASTSDLAVTTEDALDADKPPDRPVLGVEGRSRPLACPAGAMPPRWGLPLADSPSVEKKLVSITGSELLVPAAGQATPDTDEDAVSESDAMV